MLLASKGRRKQFISCDAFEIAKCKREKTISTEELKVESCSFIPSLFSACCGEEWTDAGRIKSKVMQQRDGWCERTRAGRVCSQSGRPTVSWAASEDRWPAGQRL